LGFGVWGWGLAVGRWGLGSGSATLGTVWSARLLSVWGEMSPSKSLVTRSIHQPDAHVVR
jgi:hypothetical protein